MSSERPLPTRHLERCLACHGMRLRPLPLRYEFRGAVFPLTACGDCGIRFLAVQPAPEALGEFYSAEYFEADYRCGRGTASSFEEAPFVAENRDLLEDFESLTRPGRLLEVGCAAGWLLRHAAARGWEVRGVELSEPAVRFARARGLEVHHGDLLGAALSPGHFDLVYMGDVLEHVLDCRATLAEVVRVLKPGGIFYLRGPITTNSIGRRLGLGLYGALGRTITLREPPYHLWEFMPGPLARLARAVGLEVVRLRQSKIPPGRPHGDKPPVQRLALAVLDAVNAPITLGFNVLGDRIVLVARKAQVQAPPGTRR